MDAELLDILMRLVAHHFDAGDGVYATGPVLVNVQAVRRLVAAGRAVIVSESTQRLTFRLIWPTECRHGVSLKYNCNACSDSGDDPRPAEQP